MEVNELIEVDEQHLIKTLNVHILITPAALRLA